MIYEYSALVRPGTYIKTYVARIVGPDDVYKLRRIFVPRTCHGNARGRRRYSAEIGSHGVFEVSVKYCDAETNEVIAQERFYFASSYCVQWNIERKDVLEALELIKSLGPRYKKVS